MQEDTGKSQICLAANVQGTGSLTAQGVPGSVRAGPYFES